MATILVVDDEKLIRDVLINILSDAEYETLEAGEGKEALNILNRHQVDLIIADIIMPDMEGIEIIQQLKKQKPQVKIIAMSGGGVIDAETYLSLALKSGAQKTLKKPFKTDQVLEAVREILNT